MIIRNEGAFTVSFIFRAVQHSLPRLYPRILLHIVFYTLEVNTTLITYKMPTGHFHAIIIVR